MLRTKLVALLVVLSLFATLGIANAQEGKKVLNVNWGTEPPSLDPSIATDTTSHQIITEIFPGLAHLNEETGELQPGMGTWEVADDGVTYTFHILQGIPWVKYNPDAGAVEEVKDENGNTRYVTAHNMVYAALRTLDPATAAEYGYLLSWAIQGGEAYNTAKLDELSAEQVQALRDAVAIKAVDDYTLQIVAPIKAAYIVNILATWLTAAQPSWLIDEVGDFWTEPENIQSYGPWTVKEWFHDDSLTLIKNPFWPGTDSIPVPILDEIYGVMLTADTAAFANYEAGTLDVSAAPISELDRIRADPVLSEQLYVGPSMATYYYGFNVTKPPVDNVHLRRALSYAVDRQALVTNVTKGGQVPARWFARPGLVAAPTLESHPDLGIGFDPDKAKEELALALADMGLTDVSQLPPITLMFNTSEGHARIAEAIQQMWATNLGIKVELANQEWRVYLATLNADPPQIWRLGWSMDYPDASNFDKDVFYSTSGNNHTMWGNPEFDRLVDEAAVESDPAKRVELYAQAENILVYEDAVIIPLYWYTSVVMTKPYVQRTYPVYGSTNYFEKWDLLPKE